MLRVIDEKESKLRLKESNSGSTVIHHDGKKSMKNGKCLLVFGKAIMKNQMYT